MNAMTIRAVRATKYERNEVTRTQIQSPHHIALNLGWFLGRKSDIIANRRISRKKLRGSAVIMRDVTLHIVRSGIEAKWNDQHQENWPLLELLGLASSCLEACSSVLRGFKRFKQVQAAPSTAWPGT